MLATPSTATHASLGLVVDIDLLLAHVPLDDLLVLGNLLAQADLLLDHRPLLHDDLFFQERHDELVFANLGFGGLLALHAHLFSPHGHSDPLALGAHPFANPHRPGLALAGP